ncbi:MAG: extracellular solute-binding protein, partial [Myxococcaceae bacterium]
KLWHSYRGGEELAIENAVKAFTHSTGQRVELLAVPHDAFAAKLEAAIPHGNGPDVFIFAHERVRSFEQQGLIASTEGKLDPNAYLPTALKALEVNGKTYGYPLALKCLALYVNKALVAPPPETTEELLRELARLSKPEENRFGLAYESGEPYFHAGFLFGFGGELFDAEGHALFDSAGLRRSLAFVKRLQDARFIPDEATGAKVKGLFNDGRAAMVISGPWFAGEIAPSLQYTVAPLPTVTETGRAMQPFLGVEAAFVSPHTAQLNAANALAKSLSLGKASIGRAIQGRQVPANVAAYEDPRVRDDVFLTAFRSAAERALPMPNTLEMSKTWEPLKLTLRAVLQGETLPEDAGALATRRFKALNRPKPPAARPGAFILLGAIAVVVTLIVWRARAPSSSVPLRRRYPELVRALFYVTPAAAGVAVLVMIPLITGLSLSLFHHEAGHYTFVGLANFVDIVGSHGYRITEPLSFYFTLAVTIFWTVLNVLLHVTLGLGLAILLKNPLLRLRGVFRVLLIIPWAVPNYITALIWKGMFDRQFGAINGVLIALGLEPVSWFSRWATSFAANVSTNTWLGFPFMMVVALGALQSIPQDLYEAAEVDGASKWAQFRRITLPLLRPALLPSIILGSVWTFNMFNIIYLVSGGEPGGGTDILVSEAFRWAFQRNQQYGFAAAYSVLIFVVLLGYSAFTKRVSRAAQESIS